MIYTDIIFIFAFLPVYLILSFALGEDYEKNLASVIMSLIFLVWGRPLYYGLIVINIFAVYITGLFSRRSWYNILMPIVIGTNWLALLPMAVSLASSNSIKGAVSSVGLMLFALRSAIYLADAETCREKSFLNLAVYLISFEFMAISPVVGYSVMKPMFEKRRTTLAMLCTGISRFAAGLAGVTVLGFSLERLRLASLFSGSTPYLNALIGIAAAAIEIYVVVCGYLSMSEGLAIMSGYRIAIWDSSFTPRSLMKNHLGYLWLSLSAELSRLFRRLPASAAAALIVVFCIAAGILLGFGAGVLSCILIIVMTMLIQGLFKSEKNIGSAVFTFTALAVGVVFVANVSLDGIINWFGAFAPGKYDFDLSYTLYSRLKDCWFWAVLGIIYSSPLKLAIQRRIRERMSANEGIYGAVRIFGAIETTLFIILSLIAVVSCGGGM